MGAAPGRRAGLNSLPVVRAELVEARTGANYARHLLDSVGIEPLHGIDLPEEHPALTWAHSGLMALTGRADGPPLMCPAPLAACADGVLAAYRRHGLRAAGRVDRGEWPTLVLRKRRG